MDTYTGGYRCPTCNLWVTNGSFHACFLPGGTYVPPQTQYIHVYPQTSPQYAEILTELRAIRKLLEKLND